jgi:hypothetical protein
MLWPDITKNTKTLTEGKADAGDLSETGNRKHRRMIAITYLEDRFRENSRAVPPVDPPPARSETVLRPPMPALMRGSDTRPWHLTRRQWETIRLWIEKLKEAPDGVRAPRL